MGTTNLLYWALSPGGNGHGKQELLLGTDALSSTKPAKPAKSEEKLHAALLAAAGKASQCLAGM